MPITEGSLAYYFGMFTDKFGIQWMVHVDPKYNGLINNERQPLYSQNRGWTGNVSYVQGSAAIQSPILC